MKFLGYRIEKITYYEPSNENARPNGTVEKWVAYIDDAEIYSANTKRELLDIIKENYEL